MKGSTVAAHEQEARDLLQQLHTLLPSAIMSAPCLDWSQVNFRFTRFLYKEVREVSWFNHLAFIVAILATHARLDHQTVQGYMYTLNARWRTIFARYSLTTFEEWNPLEHFPRYLEDTTLPDSCSATGISPYLCCSGTSCVGLSSLFISHRSPDLPTMDITSTSPRSVPQIIALE